MAYGTLNSDIVQSSTAGTPPLFYDGNSTQVGTLCRAWVNYKGTSTQSIRASFNVSSVTYNGTGDYTINFATAMLDANYSAVSMSSDASAGSICFIADGSAVPTASALRIRTTGNSSTANYDTAYVCVSVFR